MSTGDILYHVMSSVDIAWCQLATVSTTTITTVYHLQTLASSSANMARFLH